MPIVAAVIAIWLAVTTLREQGPTVTVSFRTAEGLEAGKTQVRYKDVEIGLVQVERHRLPSPAAAAPRQPAGSGLVPSTVARDRAQTTAWQATSCPASSPSRAGSS